MVVTWAAILLAIAALAGAALATLHFRGRSPLPMSLVLLHGSFAASGLALLVVAAAVQPDFGGLALASLVIFGIAALGGFYLVSRQLRDRALPSAVVLIHGGAAVVALLLLLWYLFQA
jgi:hypothetical protein